MLESASLPYSRIPVAVIKCPSPVLQMGNLSQQPFPHLALAEPRATALLPTCSREATLSPSHTDSLHAVYSLTSRPT